MVSARSTQRQRIQTVCVPDPLAAPECVESGVRGLVLALHGRNGIACIASCHGHTGLPWRPACNPYVYFQADPMLAQALQCILQAAHRSRLLHREWGLEGIMHPERGLCFKMQPIGPPPMLKAARSDLADLALLGRLVDYALTGRRTYPRCDAAAFRNERRNAQAVVATFAQRLEAPASQPRAWCAMARMTAFIPTLRRPRSREIKHLR